MKTGRSLQDLATEIVRRANNKQDLVANTRNLVMDNEANIHIGGKHQFGVNPIAHAQIAEHTKVPKSYYDKMLTEAPDLLANNVNRWFAKYPADRMVRCLDGKARAFLSNGYRPMENEDLATAVFPVLSDLSLDVMSCEVTDTRLYIKAVDKSVSRELAKSGAKFGDGGHTIVRVASPAITISNSEVGMGALSVLGGIYDGFCSNLATFGERSMRKYHVGKRHELVDEQTYALLSDDTRAKTDAALWSQVRDIVRAAFDRARFDALVNKVEDSQADRIDPKADVVQVVNLASRQFNLNETEGKGVLAHLIAGGDLSRFGLYNAVTRMAQDVESYDRATELERVGASVIELPRNEWQRLALAA
jgi:hypothetical protein